MSSLDFVICSQRNDLFVESKICNHFRNKRDHLMKLEFDNLLLVSRQFDTYRIDHKLDKYGILILFGITGRLI